jgi:hypothetical protein
MVFHRFNALQNQNKLKRPTKGQKIRMQTLTNDLIKESSDKDHQEIKQKLEEDRQQLKLQIKSVLHGLSDKNEKEIETDLGQFKQHLGNVPMNLKAPIFKKKKSKVDISDEEYNKIMDEIDQEVRPQVGTRNFYKTYSEVVKRHGIDLDDYLIKFGDAHYNSFMDHMKEFTEHGQEFVDGVGNGLQEALIDRKNIPKEVLEDSESFKKFAFDSHVEIYVDNGLQDILLESPIQNTEALLHCYLWPVIMTEKYNSGKNALDVVKKIVSEDVELVEEKVIEKMEDLIVKLKSNKSMDQYIRNKFEKMGLDYNELYPDQKHYQSEYQKHINELNKHLESRKDTDEDTVGDKMSKMDTEYFMREMLKAEDMYFDVVDGKDARQNQTIQIDSVKDQTKKENEVLEQENEKMTTKIYNMFVGLKDRVLNYKNEETKSKKSADARSVKSQSQKSYDFYVMNELGEFVKSKEMMDIGSSESSYKPQNPSPNRSSSVKSSHTRSTHSRIINNFTRHMFENDNFGIVGFDSYSNNSSSRSSISHHSAEQDNTSNVSASSHNVSEASVNIKSNRSDSHNVSEKSNDSMNSPSKYFDYFRRRLI